MKRRLPLRRQLLLNQELEVVPHLLLHPLLLLPGDQCPSINSQMIGEERILQSGEKEEVIMTPVLLIGRILAIIR